MIIEANIYIPLKVNKAKSPRQSVQCEFCDLESDEFLTKNNLIPYEKYVPYLY